MLTIFDNTPGDKPSPEWQDDEKDYFAKDDSSVLINLYPLTWDEYAPKLKLEIYTDRNDIQGENVFKTTISAPSKMLYVGDLQKTLFAKVTLEQITNVQVEAYVDKMGSATTIGIYLSGVKMVENKSPKLEQ